MRRGGKVHLVGAGVFGSRQVERGTIESELRLVNYW